MSDDNLSPIVERLCKFMSYSGLTNSQFADKALIPRPSLSQILNGRNKSLNDQFLAKLNVAYPELNVVWLLFGQGDMLNADKIKISEAQNDLFGDDFLSQEIDNKENVVKEFHSETIEEYGASTQTAEKSRLSPPPSPKKATPNTAKERASLPFIDIASEQGKHAEPDSLRRVKSIIVVYSDGSTEVFSPGL